MILPVFLPHLGCRQKCIYCNQQWITGNSEKPDTRETIRKALEPFEGRAEVAVYGGNPFGLGPAGLSRLFSSFDEYREKIESLRISTEPIVPDNRMINTLKEYNVRVIELGMPTFNDGMLRALGRHHTVKDLYDTHETLSREGFTIGLQVMVGLPGETWEDIRSTIQHLERLKPAILRIYPLVVLRDTPLQAAFDQGHFSPLSVEEAVHRALFIYLHASAYDIKVIKMGLTANEFLKGQIIAGPFHPAFGYLVRAQAFYLAITEVCREKSISGQITLHCNKKDIPHVTGYRRSNMQKFEKEGLRVTWQSSDLPQGLFRIYEGDVIHEGSVQDAIPMIPV
jgi:histone acetyltransferase (RNA polymerase elongator complex component)